MANTDSLEQYLLLLLSDSNLPTGGFIASSGLESYIQHGFSSSSSTKPASILDFIRQSLHACSRLNLPFVSSSHQIVASLPSSAYDDLARLDHELEVMTLNHVARRASTAQGIALLTLYERAFAPELHLSADPRPIQLNTLIERLRLGIRNSSISGHFPIGFGVLTAALGLSLPSAQHLFLFLHCRSLLSSAIRLNTLGPYVSHRLLLHDVRPLVDEELDKYRHLRVDLKGVEGSKDQLEVGAVAMTWPLGEILQARHDQLHSKIFNS